MQNKLKPATTGVIEVLNGAKIRTIMATGDNVLTAISVGRECTIIDAEVEVFLGDLKTENGVDRIVWKSTKTKEHRLNRLTLEPNRQFYEDEKKRPGHQMEGLHVSKETDEQKLDGEESINDFIQ
jgi:magnesium-transporting ATPase (P-type)